ncbi:glycosyltransferase [Thermoflexus sp.]|uniref:glycosyltransferase n=1 Tax=Thermoflexus sp. TaxID=1969742 RepID=UPI0025F70DED|nr:glycosyltransferase [Thermoflexus sp.]MDW8181003.1 glycosyltransferase [Anaerolineae bacterium]MCS6963622.1 glycosyltransferase [Thermoflexus sp.]MCS7351545.1 glycosyltransferase [Thermoflexus sp.]MCX7691328.1 glycosyltransferase [Thermoflexus sp.]MDW8184769.1 glycosyltransferase [Anaerolineae bacterium]
MKILAMASLGISILLFLYAMYVLVLTGLSLWGRRRPIPRVEPRNWPRVTVQLPIYNEGGVVERLLGAVVALDYPRDRLEIQVLDDSTDETAQRVQRQVAYYQSLGHPIELLRRPHRNGYKAGALAYGLQRARGEFIAIFDADFVPPPDFLKRMIPVLLADPSIGAVQARWSHLNAQASWITRIQALMLDAHFIVDQAARSAAGLPVNFNGSAGVWRREAIEAAGGWEGDTLTEDLDLSYRAQLAGWRLVFVPDVDVPGEVPPSLQAFKRQQFRWAKGTTQTFRKLIGRILVSRWPWWKRLVALFHLGGYFTNLLGVLLLLLWGPLLRHAAERPKWTVILGLGLLAIPLMYGLGQQALYPDWPRRVWAIPLLFLVGTGLTLNNTRAILEALLGYPSEFIRTPKGERAMDGDGEVDPTGWIEGAFALYALFLAWRAWHHNMDGVVPFLLCYAISYGIVAWHSLVSIRPSPAVLPPVSSAAPRISLDEADRRGPLSR